MQFLAGSLNLIQTHGRAKGYNHVWRKLHSVGVTLLRYCHSIGDTDPVAGLKICVAVLPVSIPAPRPTVDPTTLATL